MYGARRCCGVVLRKTVATSDPEAHLAQALRARALLAPLTFELLGDAEPRLRAIHARLKSGTADADLAHFAAPRGKDWRASMEEQVFGAFREGLVAVHYHLQRVREIENDIRRTVDENGDDIVPVGSSVAFFCRPLNVEYQGFVLAVRRTLEYLAGAVAMYFKTEGNRIRTLAQTVDQKEPAAKSEAVKARLATAQLESVIGRGGRDSVRDELTHYSSIDAGTVNIHRLAGGSIRVVLVGGGEELPNSWDDGSEDLSATLERRRAWLEDLAFGLFSDIGLS